MTALQQIIKEAKAIQRKHKNTSWKDAVSKASENYNKKHKAKKPVAKKSIHKKSKAMPLKRKTTRRKVSGVKTPSESAVMKQINKVGSEIKHLESMQKKQLMKKHKGAIGATIRKKHTELKKLIKKY